MMAYLRKRITQEQLNEAFEKVLGKAGVELASRLAWDLYLVLYSPGIY